MKKYRLFRSALVLVMVIAMAMGTTLTAFAASENKITITPNGQSTETGGAERFEAYQVFKGALSATSHDELTGIEWGDNVEKDALVAAMKADRTVMADGKKFGEHFTEEYTKWQTSHSQEYNEATMVARFLAESEHVKDPAHADEFARLVAEHLKGSPKKSTVDGGNWVIDVGVAGYYLVKDTYTGGSGDGTADGSASSYILQVVGNTTVALKATVPTVEKKVEGQNGYLTGIDGSTEMTYTLTGTVAENIGEYDTYKYKFVDTLSAGLTYTAGSASVQLTWNGGSKTLAANTDYTLTAPSDTDNTTHTLTVDFTDLKAVIVKYALGLNLEMAANGTCEGAKSVKVIVTYKAKLNEHAVMGETGNENAVKLEFSNNPYTDGTGETAPDTVKTYTVALQVKKVNESNEPMSGIKFKLRKTDGDYATLKQTTETSVGHENENVYTITGWVSDAGRATVLTTDAQGLINIHGLDIGKYTLEEVEAAKDYELMKPVSFEVTGSVQDDGSLGSVALKPGYNDHRSDVTLDHTNFAGHDAQMTLKNFKSPILPHTGGIGAGIVLGVSAAVVLLGAAVITLGLRKKKKNEQ